MAQLVYELRRHARILKSLQALPIVADMNCENSHPPRRGATLADDAGARLVRSGVGDGSEFGSGGEEQP